MPRQWLRSSRIATAPLGYRQRNRISAYLYGDILALAASGGLTVDAVRSGQGVVIVVATVVSTFFAHVLADSVAAGFEGRDWRSSLTEELRDSLPILSAGLPCLVLFAMAAAGWLSAVVAQSAAVGVLVLRLAGTGLLYRRLTGRISFAHAVWVGVAVALAGAGAAAVKIVLVH